MVCFAATNPSGEQSQRYQRLVATEGAQLLLALDRLQANRWYPSTPRLREDAQQDEAQLKRALGSTSPALRRLAVRGIGRFERPADVPMLATYLSDPDPDVRREAAHAVAQAVVHAKDGDVMPAYEALTASQPAFGRTVSALRAAAFDETRLESIARLAYARPMAQKVLETFSQLRPMLIMLRRNPGLQLTPEQLEPLLDRIKVINPLDLPGPTEFEILKRTGHLTTPLIVAASAFRCPKDILPFPCSALRELGVQSLLADNPAMAPALKAALRDPWPDVRVHALRRVGEAVKRTHDCGPLIDTLMEDRELAMVRIEALSQLDPRCNEIKDATRLAREYSAVPDSAAAMPFQGWPIRAMAIEKLAELDAAAAVDALDHASMDVWPVRAARARAAMTLRSAERLKALAEDDNPNVRTEALRGLSQLRDPSRIDLAIRNLDSPDYELVATSAEVLEHAQEPVETAMFGLWFTFKRLTKETRETARLPRLAILSCLERWAPPRENITPVRPYVEDLRVVLRDADPLVAEAASRVIHKVTGVKPVAVPTYRPPAQPAVVDLLNLPSGATITLDGGEAIEIDFLYDDAPLAVARFLALVKKNYFNGQLLFYRVAPFIVANGGSPHGNDLSGDDRFWRDEIGMAHHTAGVIGLLSHGRDTADGRFFIDLTDQPGFDYEHTLFARIRNIRLTEPWPYLNTPPPAGALVRGGGNIVLIR